MLATLGTLYDRYEPPYMWWECWRTLQMAVLVGIQVFLWESPRMQGNYALILFLVSFASHIVNKPYASDILDHLDTLSLAFNSFWVMVGFNFFMPSSAGGFYGGEDDDSQNITRFKDRLFVVALVFLGLYFLVAVIITFVDVMERVNSSQAAQKLAKLASRAHGTRADGGKERGEGSLGDGETDGEGFGSGQQGVQETDEKEEMLQEIQNTLHGSLVLKWVTSAANYNELADSYEALKQIDRNLASAVSDESKTSTFSMLPGTSQ